MKYKCRSGSLCDIFSAMAPYAYSGFRYSCLNVMPAQLSHSVNEEVIGISRTEESYSSVPSVVRAQGGLLPELLEK